MCHVPVWGRDNGIESSLLYETLRKKGELPLAESTNNIACHRGTGMGRKRSKSDQIKV